MLQGVSPRYTEPPVYTLVSSSLTFSWISWKTLLWCIIATLSTEMNTEMNNLLKEECSEAIYVGLFGAKCLPVTKQLENRIDAKGKWTTRKNRPNINETEKIKTEVLEGWEWKQSYRKTFLKSRWNSSATLKFTQEGKIEERQPMGRQQYKRENKIIKRWINRSQLMYNHIDWQILLEIPCCQFNLWRRHLVYGLSTAREKVLIVCCFQPLTRLPG